MEPGISAEASLYADLGLAPGRRGVQSIEATHVLVHERQLDPAGLVLLWQVALSGDLTCSRLHAEAEGLQALADKLQRWYPPDHEVILYEAARLPIESFRAERFGIFKERPEFDRRVAVHAGVWRPPGVIFFAKVANNLFPELLANIHDMQRNS